MMSHYVKSVIIMFIYWYEFVIKIVNKLILCMVLFNMRIC